MNEETVEEAALRVMEAAAPLEIDCRESVHQIQDHGYFDGAERYLSYYHPDATTILSYLPTDALLCLCEPRQLQETGASFMAEIEEVHAAAIAGGDVVGTISKGIIDPASVATPEVFVFAMIAG